MSTFISPDAQVYGSAHCDEERIARISGQLTAISDELHERTTR